jgi:hypothetical protein
MLRHLRRFVFQSRPQALRRRACSATIVGVSGTLLYLYNGRETFRDVSVNADDHSRKPLCHQLNPTSAPSNEPGITGTVPDERLREYETSIIPDDRIGISKFDMVQVPRYAPAADPRFLTHNFTLPPAILPWSITTITYILMYHRVSGLSLPSSMDTTVGKPASGSIRTLLPQSQVPLETYTPNTCSYRTGSIQKLKRHLRMNTTFSPHYPPSTTPSKMHSNP